MSKRVYVQTHGAIFTYKCQTFCANRGPGFELDRLNYGPKCKKMPRHLLLYHVGFLHRVSFHRYVVTPVGIALVNGLLARNGDGGEDAGVYAASYHAP